MSDPPKPTRSRDFVRFYSERWIALRLGMPMGWDGGVTTGEQRREILRREIIERGIADADVTRGEHKRPTTWRALFERAYEQPLQTTETHLALTGSDGR